jgi:hypothetical protein
LDEAQAYAWFNIAAAHGNKKAANGRSIISKKMTPEQIAEGQRLSRAFADKVVK